MTPVIIRSRTDTDRTWTGIISTIDFENPNQNNDNYYYGNGNNEQSTSYPFYVELDSSEDLILGQHVYIEPDYGQSEKKDGLWLMEGYFVFDGNDAYIWKMNQRNRLEKVKVTTGEYDPDMMEYQIISGIEKTDYITWPGEDLSEGMPCIINGNMEVAE